MFVIAGRLLLFEEERKGEEAWKLGLMMMMMLVVVGEGRQKTLEFH